MCTVQLPPGGNPIAVNKYIINEKTGSDNRKLTDIMLQMKQSNIELHTTPDGSNPMNEMDAWFAQKKRKSRG
jgi:hypothetical protein